MLITLFSIIIPAIVFIIIKKKCGGDDCPPLVGFVVLTSLLLYLMLHLFTYPVKLERPVITDTQKIVAMKTDSKTEGETSGGLFFYRCRIDEVDYYVYLVEDAGIYKQEKVPVEYTVIKETTDQPKIIKNTKYVKNGLPNTIRFKCKGPEKVGESDTIFVPEGTISDCSKYIVF